MSIQLIDKIKQKNDGNFYLVDAVDVEYNKKSLIDALKAGDIIPAGGGTSAGTFHVANINIGSNTAFDSSKLTPEHGLCRRSDRGRQRRLLHRGEGGRHHRHPFRRIDRGWRRHARLQGSQRRQG